MPLKINKTQAIALVRAEAMQAESGQLDSKWIERVERLSRLCDEGVSKTHLAFLGTAMIAKSMNHHADLFAIKPNHADGNPNAFSARTLCHSVLVPLAAELGINIGVTGREPLNNQPYFRMTRLDDGTPVHSGGIAAFNYMLECVRELQSHPDEDSGKLALRAFIAVRRRYQPRYIDYDETTRITPDGLILAIQAFVQKDSEHGRRAQAVVAGLMDAFAGKDRVESGRIHDPSRNYPGDVCVRSVVDSQIWEKAFEVRDKPVIVSDVQIFGKKCIDMGVREGALVMVSEQQITLDVTELTKWANGFGLGLTLFHGWHVFIEQALFWAGDPKPVAAIRAAAFIYQRLKEVEASGTALTLWQSLMREHKPALEDNRAYPVRSQLA